MRNLVRLKLVLAAFLIPSVAQAQTILVLGMVGDPPTGRSQSFVVSVLDDKSAVDILGFATDGTDAVTSTYIQGNGRTLLMCSGSPDCRFSWSRSLMKAGDNQLAFIAIKTSGAKSSATTMVTRP